MPASRVTTTASCRRRGTHQDATTKADDAPPRPSETGARRLHVDREGEDGQHEPGKFGPRGVRQPTPAPYTRGTRKPARSTPRQERPAVTTEHQQAQADVSSRLRQGGTAHRVHDAGPAIRASLRFLVGAIPVCAPSEISSVALLYGPSLAGLSALFRGLQPTVTPLSTT